MKEQQAIYQGKKLIASQALAYFNIMRTDHFQDDRADVERANRVHQD